MTSASIVVICTLLSKNYTSCNRRSLFHLDHRRVASPILTAFVCVFVFVPFYAGADEPDGEKLFQSRCGSCHSLENGRNKIGPHLSEIIGRRAASINGATYSGALKDSGIVWDASTLDAFLSAPQDMVPGSRMRLKISSPTQRSAIISYLSNQ